MKHNELATALRELSDDRELLWDVARRAIEDELIDWRDRGLSLLGRNNGLVVKYPDGSDSASIRMGPETAVRIGLQALADHLEKVDNEVTDS